MEPSASGESRLDQRALSEGVLGRIIVDKLDAVLDAGVVVFLYLVLPSSRDDFRAFLGRHADLFRTLPFWTLRLLFPRSIADAYPGLQSVVRDELESPLHARTVEELRWYARYRDGF